MSTISKVLFVGSVVSYTVCGVAHYISKKLLKSARDLESAESLPISMVRQKLNDNDAAYVCISGLVQANESYLKTIYDNGKYETVARRRMTIRIAEKQSVSAARDERGDTQHTHSSWRRENELVFDECETIPFMINDNTGVPINVVFASIHELPLKRVWMHFKPNDSKDVNLNLNVGVPMVGDVGSRTIGTQDEEWILPLDKVCLVIGEARLNLDGTMSIGSPRTPINADKPFMIRQNASKSLVVAEAEESASTARSVTFVSGVIGTVLLLSAVAVMLFVEYQSENEFVSSAPSRGASYSGGGGGSSRRTTRY